MHRVNAWLEQHRWMALTAGVALLCLYLLVTELVPRATVTYGMLRQWRSQETQLAAVQQWNVEQLTLSARKRQLQRRFADLYVSLPKSDHMSTLLQVLQESADTSAVTIGHVRPTERIPFGTYDELPFEVELHGDFHNLGRFVNWIEQSPYVIKVKGLTLERRSVTSSRLDATLLLSVIILNEQGGAG